MKTSLLSMSSIVQTLALSLLLSAVVPSASAQRSKLTQAQISHLIQIHAPDDLVASQIEARGIRFSATKADLILWTSQGAGPRTLDVLRSLIRTGSVQLRTEPGAAASLDGNAVGNANAAGLLLIDDVVPGQHQLAISKDGFRANEQAFTLGDREARQISVPLAWAGGILTLTAQPANASIAVTGPVSFAGPLNAARCPPGEYSISVSMPGYVTQTRPLTVSAGQIYQQHFQLEVDPVLLKKTLADAQASLSGGDFDSAIRLSRQVVNLDPSNGPAYAILAEALFQDEDLREFAENASRAIQAGQSITIPLMHIHSFPRQLVHRVDMTISAEGLAFVIAPGTKCKMPASVNYRLLANPSIGRDAFGNAVLHLVWSEHPQGFGTQHELDFVPLGSGMVKQQLPPGTIPIFGSPTVLRIPENANAQYDAIIQLIGQASK